MRRSALVMTLALLALLPAAQAQLVQGVLIVDDLRFPSDPVDPGASFQVQAEVVRVCPNQGAVLAEQEVDLFAVPNGPPGNGTPQAVLTFPSHACLTDSRQEATIPVPLVLPEDVERNATIPYTLTLHPHDLGLGETGAEGESRVPFAVTSTAAPAEPVVEPEPVQEMPGVGPVVLLAGVALAGLAMRRRSA